MLSGYSYHGRVDETFKLLVEMFLNGVQAYHITFTVTAHKFMEEEAIVCCCFQKPPSNQFTHDVLGT